jgi:hypothetical protein
VTISVPTAAGVLVGIAIYVLRRGKAEGLNIDKEVEKYAKELGLDSSPQGITSNTGNGDANTSIGNK